MGPVFRHQHAAGTEWALRRRRALFTQVLPFYDERVVALYGAFERGLYGLA
jgi:hypothetical protein